MTTFILVHGALHGGWCWDKVVRRLAENGHLALAPDLPGMGESRVRPQDVSLAMTGGFIADLASRQQGEVVVVGHSLGGVTISEAAERAPDAIAGLVYVAAVLAPTGVAAADVFASGEPSPGLSYSDDGATFIDDLTHARERFYNGCDEADVRWALSRLSPQPTRPLGDKLALTSERFGAVPRAYVECLNDNALPLALQRSQQLVLPCHPVFAMDTGHSPFMEAPGDLCANLIAAADAFKKHRPAKT